MTEMDANRNVVTRPDLHPALRSSYRNRFLPFFVVGWVKRKYGRKQSRYKKKAMIY